VSPHYEPTSGGVSALRWMPFVIVASRSVRLYGDSRTPSIRRSTGGVGPGRAERELV